MLDLLLSLVAPHLCLGCGTEGELWCDVCKTSAPPAAERCYRCHALSPGGRTCMTCRRASPLYAVLSATRYEGVPKQLIWKLKFERTMAGARPIADLIATRFEFISDVVMVPVPTSTNRVRQRGYDQTVLITKALARHAPLPFTSALIRLGQQQQHTASRQQRLTQLANAFRVVKPEAIQGKRVMLIDDVITTGATLEAAARALKQAGAKRVSALVFAQA